MQTVKNQSHPSWKISFLQPQKKQSKVQNSHHPQQQHFCWASSSVIHFVCTPLRKGFVVQIFGIELSMLISCGCLLFDSFGFCVPFQKDLLCRIQCFTVEVQFCSQLAHIITLARQIRNRFLYCWDALLALSCYSSISPAV